MSIAAEDFYKIDRRSRLRQRSSMLWMHSNKVIWRRKISGDKKKTAYEASFHRWALHPFSPLVFSSRKASGIFCPDELPCKWCLVFLVERCKRKKYFVFTRRVVFWKLWTGFCQLVHSCSFRISRTQIGKVRNSAVSWPQDYKFQMSISQINCYNEICS